MNWYQGKLVAFDLETTGVDVETDRIVTAAVITIDPLAGSVDTTEWLADPGVEIPAEATGVHGISTEMARTTGRPAGEVVGEVVSMLTGAWRAGLPVIVYNAAYDLSLLDREHRRYWHGIPLTPAYVVDPFVLDKQHDRYRRGSRKLVNTARHYGIELTELDAHGAAADALAAARVAWKIARVYPALGAMPLAELHEKQTVWHAEQARSLAEYFRRKGSSEHVPTEWPLQPLAVRADA